MRQLGGLEQLAFLDEREPVRDVVVHRALPFAIRVAAGEATAGLGASVRAVVGTIDLAVMLDTSLCRLLLRVLARHL